MYAQDNFHHSALIANRRSLPLRWLAAFFFAALGSALCSGAFATGAPGAPTLTQDTWSGFANYKVVMNMWWGNNGTTWQLFENGSLVFTTTLVDQSPNPQTASYSVTNKPRGTYLYTSKLINSLGSTSGPTLTYTVTEGVAAAVPAVPSGLTATVNSATQITVTWNPVSGATHYDLQRDGVTQTGASSPFVHPGLTSGSVHTYSVRAVNSVGASAWSPIVSATTTSPTTTAPAVPAGLSATAVSTNAINVTWAASANVTGYDLLQDGALVSNVVTPYLHSGLVPGSAHTYAVRAKNSVGISAWSASVSATTATTSTGLTLGQVANPNGRYFSGYYPSWSDNWFMATNWDGSKKSDNDIYTTSNLAKVPGVYTHVMLAFGQPDFSWSGLAANNWSGTGLNFTATPADIKEVIRLQHVLRKKVILALGGATYNSWTSLAGEAGRSNTPIKTALTRFVTEMGIDGLDVDFEIATADAANVRLYAQAIQAMREAVDAAGSGHLLTIAAWSTGADYTADTTQDAGYPGTPSYWGGGAGRERQTFRLSVPNGPLAGRSVASLFDIVNVMSYDAQTLHYDPVTAFDQYRALVPSSIPVSLGLEIPPEGWAGGMLVINNADAGASGTVVVADQYGRTPRGPYSVERFGNYVVANSRTANPHDGLMLWQILKTQSVSAGAAPSANATSVERKVTSLFGYVPRAP